jgi:DNA-binding CsgD family transcriptional regulator
MSPEQAAQIHEFWDTLGDLSSADPVGARTVLLERLCALIPADNAMWAGVVRVSQGDGDPLHGWRMPVITYLHPLPGIDAAIRSYQQGLEAAPDSKSIAYHAGAGTFRVHRVAELVSPEWFQGDFYRTVFRHGLEAEDMMFVGAPVNEQVEAGLAFYRRSGRFASEECALVEYSLRSLRWFQRSLLLGHGVLMADGPLTPVEQKVLEALLQGKSAKEIAAAVGQTVNTTNEYLRRIYRKYAVSSRPELMALWLGTPPSEKGAEAQAG